MSAIDLGSALEELIRRIVRDELSKHGGKSDDDATVDNIEELVAKDVAKLRAARARPAPRHPRGVGELGEDIEPRGAGAQSGGR
jgi:hypothetical protein